MNKHINGLIGTIIDIESTHDDIIIAKAITKKDPNGSSLEFCFLTRDIGNEDDVTMQERAEISIERWLGDNYINDRVSSKVEEPALADD